MDEYDTKEIAHQTKEAIYILKTIDIKGRDRLKQEVYSIIYKAYTTGKEAK